MGTEGLLKKLLLPGTLWHLYSACLYKGHWEEVRAEHVS